MAAMVGVLSDVREHWHVYAAMPLVAALIGYVTKVLAVEMMFRPLEFRGIPPIKALQPSLPKALADAETLTNVLGTYDENLESVLTVLPAVVAAIESVVPPENLELDIPLVNMSFKANINSPPPCTTGFPDGERQRSTDDLSPVPPPNDSYCKVAGDDPRIVRGARNIRCPNSTKRAATPTLCGLVFPRFAAPDAARGRVRIVAIDPGRDHAVTSDGRVVPLDRISLPANRPLSLRQLMQPGIAQ